MNREYPYVEENDPLREGLEKLRSTKTKMIVVQSGSILQGALSIEHIKQDSNISVLKVKDVMNPNPITIGDNANIHEALDLLTRSADGKLIVMNHEKNGQVLGTITLSEIADAYNREIRKIKMEMAEQ
ncbi:MAG: CBS domain-containing protein [Thermoplasmatales archaeon]|nr:CBS domain-containing protein [Thermoplasmatales archaeon]MCW6171153.1 CBS domain-containing protein [Thermoplasmatales archaeon]